MPAMFTPKHDTQVRVANCRKGNPDLSRVTLTPLAPKPRSKHSGMMSLLKHILGIFWKIDDTAEPTPRKESWLNVFRRNEEFDEFDIRNVFTREVVMENIKQEEYLSSLGQVSEDICSHSCELSLCNFRRTLVSSKTYLEGLCDEVESAVNLPDSAVPKACPFCCDQSHAGNSHQLCHVTQLARVFWRTIMVFKRSFIEIKDCPLARSTVSGPVDSSVLSGMNSEKCPLSHLHVCKADFAGCVQPDKVQDETPCIHVLMNDVESLLEKLETLSKTFKPKTNVNDSQIDNKKTAEEPTQESCSANFTISREEASSLQHTSMQEDSQGNETDMETSLTRKSISSFNNFLDVVEKQGKQLNEDPIPHFSSNNVNEIETDKSLDEHISSKDSAGDPTLEGVYHKEGELEHSIEYINYRKPSKTITETKECPRLEKYESSQSIARKISLKSEYSATETVDRPYQQTMSELPSTNSKKNVSSGRLDKHENCQEIDIGINNSTDDAEELVISRTKMLGKFALRYIEHIENKLECEQYASSEEALQDFQTINQIQDKTIENQIAREESGPDNDGAVVALHSKLSTIFKPKDSKLFNKIETDNTVDSCELDKCINEGNADFQKQKSKLYGGEETKLVNACKDIISDLDKIIKSPSSGKNSTPALPESKIPKFKSPPNKSPTPSKNVKFAVPVTKKVLTDICLSLTTTEASQVAAEEEQIVKAKRCESTTRLALYSPASSEPLKDLKIAETETLSSSSTTSKPMKDLSIAETIFPSSTPSKPLKDLTIAETFEQLNKVVDELLGLIAVGTPDCLTNGVAEAVGAGTGEGAAPEPELSPGSEACIETLPSA